MNAVELTASGSMSLDGPKEETVRVNVLGPSLSESVITENSHLKNSSVVEQDTAN